MNYGDVIISVDTQIKKMPEVWTKIVIELVLKIKIKTGRPVTWGVSFQRVLFVLFTMLEAKYSVLLICSLDGSF